MAIVKNIKRLSDLPVLSRIVKGVKAVVAYNRNNYQVDATKIKGTKISSITEDMSTESGGKNVIAIRMDDGTRFPIVVFNGSQGDKGKTGKDGEKGPQGTASENSESRSENYLNIANTNESTNASEAWSAFKGKEMADSLRGLQETFVTEREYDLLFNEVVWLEATFDTTSENETVTIFNDDTNKHIDYVKYWTYEDSDMATYYVYNPVSGTYDAVSVNIWEDVYLGGREGYFEATQSQRTDATPLYYYDTLRGEYVEIDKDDIGNLEYDYYVDALETYIHVSYSRALNRYKYSMIADSEIIPEIYTFDGTDYELVASLDEVDTEGLTTYYDADHNEIPNIGQYIAEKAVRTFVKNSDGGWDEVEDASKVDVSSFQEYIVVTIDQVAQTYEFDRLFPVESHHVLSYDEKKVLFDQNSMHVYAHSDDRRYYTSEMVEQEDAEGNPTYVNVYTEVQIPIWIIATFESDYEDEEVKLLNSRDELGEEDNTKVDEQAELVGEFGTTDVKIESIRFSENPLVLFNGEPKLLDVTITPQDAVWNDIEITYDDSKITFYEDGRIAAVVDNCETDVVFHTLDGSDIEAILHVKLTTPMKKLVITEDKSVVYVNKTHALQYTYEPANTSITEVEWTTSDPDIAEVDEDGMIMAWSEGKATITAKAKDGFGATATHEVEVTIPVESIAFDQPDIYDQTDTEEDEEGNVISSVTYKKIQVLMNREYDITPVVEPEAATYQTIAWTYLSGTRNVATIVEREQEEVLDEEGNAIIQKKRSYILKATRAGETVLQGRTTDGTALTIQLHIESFQAVTSIDVEPAMMAFNVGTTKQLTATVNPDDAQQEYVWSSDDEAVATVSEAGVITAVAPGQTLVRATAQDGSDVFGGCNVTVTSPIKNIDLNVGNEAIVFVGIGKTAQISCVIEPVTASNQTCVWETSDEAIATVTQDGVVTGVSIGRVTILAHAQDGSGVVGTCQIEVIKCAEAISFEESEYTMNINDAIALIPVFDPVDTSIEIVTWHTSDASIATVSNGGIVEAHALGTCEVSATTTDGTNLTASCTITIA